MSLFKLVKKNRPSTGFGMLRESGVPGMDNPQDADLGFEALLKMLAFGAGVNHIIQVFDCESVSGVTESDSGTFDIAAAAAAGKRVGTNCMKLVATAACDGTQYVDVTYINESEPCPLVSGLKKMDWSDTAYLGWWNNTANSGDFGTAGEMKVAIVYGGGEVSDSVDIPATVGTVHQWVEFAYSDFGTDVQWDKVEAIRFYCDNANAAEYVQYDDIIRYEISYNRAPFYGGDFPIKSGTTLVQGNSVKWTIDGLITGAADAPTLGAVWLPDGDSVLGTDKRDKWGYIPGVRIGLTRANTTTTAGDMFEWVSGTYSALVADVTTTTTGKGYGMSLEAAGAQYDDIMCLYMKVGNSA